MSDIDYQPMKQPGCLDKIVILAMMVISAIFFRQGKQKR